MSTDNKDIDTKLLSEIDELFEPSVDFEVSADYINYLSKDECIKALTTEYLYADDFDITMPPSQIKEELLQKMHDVFTEHNEHSGKGAKWQLPSSLYESQIADVLLRLYPICRIACAGANADTEYDLLAIYQTEGPDEGIYVTKENVFNELIRQFNYTISTKSIHEVIMTLKDITDRKLRCTEPDLIAVNNGIFNYETKQLMPFDPEYIFISKSRVNYNPLAKNVVIHNDDDGTDWDVESWVAELSDNQEIVELLWQIMGAIIRPHVNWNKSAWFYSTRGNNGKGTLCSLMRNICGKESYASIPLADFGKDFMLEPLIQAQAIIVDENNVGEFIDKAANLKAVITNDVIQLNRKFKTPIAYQFYGFMVQCINELPRIKDKSDSFYRRQLFVPFEKCFTGHERRYIKADYLCRKEVLEYVLFKVLHMDYYELNEPDECKNALSEYKMFNDPIKQFIDEFISQCVWDVLPFSFLYDGYKAWYKRNSPEGKMQGKSTFITDLINGLTKESGWYCPGRTKAIKTGTKMDKPELLIIEYDLVAWKNPYYRGQDKNAICKAPVKQTVNGIVRI